MKLAETAGRHAASEMSRLVDAQIYAPEHAVEKAHIDCEFELRRSYDVFRSERDAKGVEASWCRGLLGGQHEWTEDVQWLGPDLAERLTSVQGGKRCVRRACVLLLLVTGLLERPVAWTRRLNLQTGTPVLRVQAAGDGGNVVHTARGAVMAEKVIFATNAYAAALLPRYRGVTTPYKGTAAPVSGR